MLGVHTVLPGVIGAQGRTLLSPGAVNGAMSFSRASSGSNVSSNGATIVSAASDAPRFNGTAQRLLLEGARTNLLANAITVAGSGWTNSGIGTAVAASAPDGTTNAALMTENTSATAHRTSSSSVSFVSGGTYVYSVYAKAGTCPFIQLILPNAAFGVNVWGNFDLSGGTLGTIGATTTATITAAGGGWYRCSIAGAATASASAAATVDMAASASQARGASYTGTGRDVTLWGAQIEQAGFASSLIPPLAGSAAQTTRATDVLTAPISGFFATAAGTLLLSAMIPQNAASSADQVIAQISDGTDANRIRLRNIAGGATIAADFVVSGSSTASITLGSMTAGTAFKAAIAWSGTGLAGLLAGGSAQSVTATPPGGLSALRLGNNVSGSAGLFGEIGTARALPYAAPSGSLSTLLAGIS